MRKFIYSGGLKLAAVILLVGCIVLGALTVSGGLMAYFNEEPKVYDFERDFSQSWFVADLLSGPEREVNNAYSGLFYVYNDQYTPIEGTLDKSAVERNLRERFADYYYDDKINYYVQWNDLVLTNCDAKTPEDLTQDGYYSYIKRDSNGKIDRMSNIGYYKYNAYWIEDLYRYDNTSTVTVSCSIKEEVAREYQAIWQRQESIVLHTFVMAVVYAVAALLLLIYLLCVCGRDKDGNHKPMWLDKIWLEVQLSVMAGAGIGAIVLCLAVLQECVRGNFLQTLVYWVTGVAAALGSFLVVASLLSIVRNLKAGQLVDRSIILRTLRRILCYAGKLAKWTGRKGKAAYAAMRRLLSKKTGVLLITMLLVYTALIGFLGLCAEHSPECLVLGVIVFGAAAFVVAYRAKDLDEIKEGVSRVRNGNVAHQIGEIKCEDMKQLAQNINHIAQGLDESVSAKVKAERMKSELITNVSHDLKTPITSIMNYTQLLTQVEGLPEEAKDYVAVIEKKSQRLKRLTQDLFDISKAQSGNENVVFEKLNVALLISQALAEHDKEIQSAGLPFCVETPKELHILADGRKMSRVVSNLIHNILKYTMKNTRVFITASEKDGVVELEFKNISAYPLNFRPEEITQRFVRGDESRTEEGNGLGLAIAKSYTQICNGTFEIVVDGDMFKAILRFPAQ